MASSGLAKRKERAGPDEWKPERQHLDVAAWQAHRGRPHSSALAAYKSYPPHGAPRFPEIERAIEHSRDLTTLPEDWDDAGARRIEQSTWKLAVAALRDAAKSAYRRFNYSLPAPKIGPCADGSIDLYWNNSDFQLLINVKPQGTDKPSDYYGEMTGTDVAVRPKVQGPFDPTAPDFDFLGLLVKR